jgi:hypothetical protein
MGQVVRQHATSCHTAGHVSITGTEIKFTSQRNEFGGTEKAKRKKIENKNKECK